MRLDASHGILIQALQAQGKGKGMAMVPPNGLPIQTLDYNSLTCLAFLFDEMVLVFVERHARYQTFIFFKTLLIICLISDNNVCSREKVLVPQCRIYTEASAKKKTWNILCLSSTHMYRTISFGTVTCKFYYSSIVLHIQMKISPHTISEWLMLATGYKSYSGKQTLIIAAQVTVQVWETRKSRGEIQYPSLKVPVKF